MSSHVAVGIIGGGQLGLMTAEAAQELGFPRVTVLDPTPGCPAAAVAEQIVGSLQDPAAIRQLAQRVDVLSFEIEHVNAQALQELAEEGMQIYPAPASLALIQNKYWQKEFLAQHAIPVAPFMAVASQTDIEKAASLWGYPLVLKAQRDAYDGRGNARIASPQDIEPALDKLSGRALYVEKGLELAKELGIMIARNTRGEITSFPVVEMIHERDICQTVLAPAPISLVQQRQAQALAHQTVQHLQGAGIFGIEMFLDTTGQIWLNEIAPRPHNLGHYTIEACQTSQFAQYLRAITNLPLPSNDMLYPAAVMINILGTRNGPAEFRWIGPHEQDNVFVHLYGKRETKIDRKMGHITVVGDTLATVYERAKETRAALSI